MQGKFSGAHGPEEGHDAVNADTASCDEASFDAKIKHYTSTFQHHTEWRIHHTGTVISINLITGPSLYIEPCRRWRMRILSLTRPSGLLDHSLVLQYLNNGVIKSLHYVLCLSLFLLKNVIGQRPHTSRVGVKRSVWAQLAPPPLCLQPMPSMEWE